MSRLTKEERAELEARLAADDDDDDDEVEYTHSDGRKLRGRFSRVSDFAAALGTSLKAAPPAEPAGKDDGKGKDGPVRFAGRRVS